MNRVTKFRVNLCLLSYSWLTRTVFSRLLKKAVSMALWTMESLCVKSSLLEQSLPRTPSRSKTSVISVISVAKNLCNLLLKICVICGKNLRNPWLINDLRPCKALYNCRDASTSIEDSLQIAPFMQNEPNFRKSQMNVNKVLSKDYENKDTWWSGKNEPKTNPIYPCVASGEAGTNPICQMLK